MSDHNSVEHNTDTNKNLSKYDRLWLEIRDKLNFTAKDYVPQMYDALKQDGYTPKEARDKIKRDALNIWKPETIDKWIPEEAKQEVKVLAGQQTNKTKQEIQEVVYKDSPRLESSRNDEELAAQMESDAEAMNLMYKQGKELGIYKDEFFEIPPNKFRKVFMGMMKLRQTAEQTGVRININTFEVL